MTTDFTGSDTWHTTISGPATAQAVTAASVYDMGVLQADREIWLKNRLVGCGRILEEVQVVDSTLLSSLIDLKGTATYTLIPGMEVTLATTVAVGDIIVVECHVHASYQGDVLGTNYLKLAISAPGVPIFPNASARVISDEALRLQPVQVDTIIKVASIAVPTQNVGLYGASATTTNNTFALIATPFSLRVLHIRPVAAP